MLTFFKPCPRKTMFQTVAGKKFFEFTLDIAGQQAPLDFKGLFRNL